MHRYGIVTPLRRAVREAADDNITKMAAALAYYLFLAIPSALLVAAGAFSLATPQDSSVIESVTETVAPLIPPEAETLVRQSLERLAGDQSTGGLLLAIGVVTALWSLGNAMRSIIWAVNIAFDRIDRRGFFRRSADAYAMLLFTGIAFALAFGVLALGPASSAWVGDAVGAPELVRWLWWIGEWPILVGGLLVSYSAVVSLGLEGERLRWRGFTLGGIVAVAIWLAASAAFALFVSRFGSYNKAWGSVSAVVVMLTWLWLGGVALLFGAEVDAEGAALAGPTASASL